MGESVVTFEYPCSWVGVRTGQVLALQPANATLSASQLHNPRLLSFLRFLYRINQPTHPELLAMDDEKAKAEKLAAAKKRVCLLFRVRVTV